MTETETVHPQSGSLRRDVSASAVVMGALASLVGFSSSFAIVLAALDALGATPEQAATGLMAASVAMGACGIWFSLKLRAPVSVAWTTPGAAFLITVQAPSGGLPEAVGAFILCALLLIATGLFKPLARAIEAIPAQLANAMLAGILMPLCLAPVRAVAELPWLALPIILVWLVVLRMRRLFAVPAALIAFALVLWLGGPTNSTASIALWVSPEPILPTFSFASAISLALPLFIITMASQNVPGVAVLRANGYDIRSGPLIRDTGIASLLAAPFAGVASNLSAIVASMCCGEDVHPDRRKRYVAALTAGIGYVLLGLLAGPVAGLLVVAPPILIAAVAGLALVPSFMSSLFAAFQPPHAREATAVTFLTAASGVTFLSISGAFWGLIAGGAVYALLSVRRMS